MHRTRQIVSCLNFLSALVASGVAGDCAARHLHGDATVNLIIAAGLTFAALAIWPTKGVTTDGPENPSR
jgi:hypothetical protein